MKLRTPTDVMFHTPRVLLCWSVGLILLSYTSRSSSSSGSFLFAQAATSPYSASILATTIPRSTHRTEDSPPWNPSSQIDEKGFLKETYTRCPGDWEEEAKLGGKHGPRSRRFQTLGQVPVQIRQVPGDGNCLFHSIATCLSYCLNGTHVSKDDLLQHLQCTSSKLRQRAVDCLQKDRKLLFLQGDEYLRARDLVEAAALQYGLSGEDYCSLMRQESYWGGGPEIVALCNVLRRPIHVYELHSCKKTFQLRRMACFGSPKFDRREPLHILSADSRFPDVTPGRQLQSGNHFLSLFPLERHLSLRKRQRQSHLRKVRGGEAVKKELERQRERQLGLVDHDGWNRSLVNLVSLWWDALSSLWMRPKGV